MATDTLPRTCSLTHCDEPHSAHGYCKAHWQRISVHGDKADLLKPIRKTIKRPKYVGCKVEGCEGKHQGYGYCYKHYQQTASSRPHRLDDPAFIVKFWSKVVLTADDTRCWDWQGLADKDGYGMTQIGNGHKLRATHVSFYLTHGQLPPKGLWVLHHCDRPACVNPRHLYAGTPKQNQEDMHRRNRANPPRGMRHPLAKLTDEKVRYIRQQAALGRRGVDIASDLGISNKVVSRVATGKIWKHVTL